MNNTERIVRVMVFYKINIFKEIIFRALQDLLPDYVLNITQVDSTEQALAAVADNNVDVFFTEFNYLLNHKEWSAEVRAAVLHLYVNPSRQACSVGARAALRAVKKKFWR